MDYLTMSTINESSYLQNPGAKGNLTSLPLAGEMRPA